jgi:hypothetical protein
MKTGRRTTIPRASFRPTYGTTRMLRSWSFREFIDSRKRYRERPSGPRMAQRGCCGAGLSGNSSFRAQETAPRVVLTLASFKQTRLHFETTVCISQTRGRFRETLRTGNSRASQVHEAKVKRSGTNEQQLLEPNEQQGCRCRLRYRSFRAYLIPVTLGTR